MLEMSARGHTSRVIAAALEISPGTVDTYRRRIARKLGLPSRANLAIWTLQHKGLAAKASA